MCKTKISFRIEKQLCLNAELIQTFYFFLFRNVYHKKRLSWGLKLIYFIYLQISLYNNTKRASQKFFILHF